MTGTVKAGIVRTSFLLLSNREALYFSSYHRYHSFVIFAFLQCMPICLFPIPIHPDPRTNRYIKESREHMTPKSLQSRSLSAAAARPKSSHAFAVSFAAPAFEVLVPTTFPLIPRFAPAPSEPLTPAAAVVVAVLDTVVTKKPCSS